MKTVNIIGAGLAGCEAAYYLANNGFKVKLFDIKPHKKTPAHHSESLAELVCSNSLKNNDPFSNACGLLKEEMRLLNSLIIKAADNNKVAAGAALAVDREKFSKYITDTVTSHKNIEFISQEVDRVDKSTYTIIATGPLTTDKLFKNIKEMTCGELYFYDAAAPLVTFDSIDMQSAFFGERYKEGGTDYINCPINKEEYDELVKELAAAERANLHEFEKECYFEGCMPVEALAVRGPDTLRYGPLKPKGLDDPKTGRYPYACLQLRRENAQGSLYNLVGFQTNLKFFEQKRVFSIIKALKNAEYVRYGVMHRNTYINAPQVLKFDYSMKEFPNIYFAGQITGVEGYVESASSGLSAAINLKRSAEGALPIDFGKETVTGALCAHVSTENKNFQPMNANYGILAELKESVRDKKLKKKLMSERALQKIKDLLQEL